MPRIPKSDSIEKFFEYDIHLDSCTIFIGAGMYDDEVDFSMAERAVKGLHLLDASTRAQEKGINLIINTMGGDEYFGLSIYDAIKGCKNHVTATVYGSAMSMGSWILQAADLRIMSPNSTMMVHYGSFCISDNAMNAYRMVDEYKRLDKLMEKVYLEKIRIKHPKFRLSKLKQMLTLDTFLTPKQTVELGLADKILGE